ncbi:MAG: hypothetical protein JXP73_01715 [Deltaproteobacteria bacterium]|nr:hypothetical protein [Deltaproteobacteria bacterium]
MIGTPKTVVLPLLTAVQLLSTTFAQECPASPAAAAAEEAVVFSPAADSPQNARFFGVAKTDFVFEAPEHARVQGSGGASAVLLTQEDKTDWSLAPQFYCENPWRLWGPILGLVIVLLALGWRWKRKWAWGCLGTMVVAGWFVAGAFGALSAMRNKDAGGLYLDNATSDTAFVYIDGELLDVVPPGSWRQHIALSPGSHRIRCQTKSRSLEEFTVAVPDVKELQAMVYNIRGANRYRFGRVEYR